MPNKIFDIWKYVKNYKFNSIFIKTFFLIFLPTLLPLTLISTSIYNYYGANIRQEIKTSNINGLSKIKNIMDKTALECDRLSLWLAADMDIQLLLASPHLWQKDFNLFSKFSHLTKVMNVIEATNDVINSTFVYFQKSDFVMATNGYSMDFESFYDKEWKYQYDEIKTLNKNWVSPRKVIGQFNKQEIKYYLSSFRTLSNFNEEGVVVVNIDIQKLKGIIDTVDGGQHHDLFILDNKGIVLYSFDQSFIGSRYQDIPTYDEIYIHEAGSFFIIDDQQVEKVVTIQDSEYNQWRYIYSSPISQYSERTEEFIRYMLLLLTASLIITLVISFFISVKVFQPVKNMVSLMDSPKEWEGMIKIEDESKFNEFKYAAKNMLKSINRAKQMEEELAERVEMLRKAQSVALQAQINPHFLYNTLETINWKAMGLTGGENDVSEMLGSLSRLLRLSLENSSNMVTIKEEINHAELYLRLQAMRYQDKFTVQWCIDEEIFAFKTLKLTLQPLLENAIYHGIKPKKGKGIIKIEGKRYDNAICIKIKDNGVGMNAEDVANLNSHLQEDYVREGAHIGVKNVNQRFKLFFGDEYGLILDSKLNEYTVVCLSIPIIQ